MINDEESGMSVDDRKFIEIMKSVSIIDDATYENVSIQI